MKQKHPDHFRMIAISEYKNKRSMKAVALRLGVPETTIRCWIRAYRVSERIIPETPREENNRQFLLQRNRMIQEFTNDPNVNLMGKPPIGRSALDQKRAKESENKNETSETNPYSIRRYYRQPR
jgi:hypothetical protein